MGAYAPSQGTGTPTEWQRRVYNASSKLAAWRGYIDSLTVEAVPLLEHPPEEPPVPPPGQRTFAMQLALSRRDASEVIRKHRVVVAPLVIDEPEPVRWPGLVEWDRRCWASIADDLPWHAKPPPAPRSASRPASSAAPPGRIGGFSPLDQHSLGRLAHLRASQAATREREAPAAANLRGRLAAHEALHPDVLQLSSGDLCAADEPQLATTPSTTSTPSPKRRVSVLSIGREGSEHDDSSPPPRPPLRRGRTEEAASVGVVSGLPQSAASLAQRAVGADMFGAHVAAEAAGRSRCEPGPLIHDVGVGERGDGEKHEERGVVGGKRGAASTGLQRPLPSHLAWLVSWPADRAAPPPTPSNPAPTARAPLLVPSGREAGLHVAAEAFDRRERNLVRRGTAMLDRAGAHGASVPAFHGAVGELFRLRFVAPNNGGSSTRPRTARAPRE